MRLKPEDSVDWHCFIEQYNVTIMINHQPMIILTWAELNTNILINYHNINLISSSISMVILWLTQPKEITDFKKFLDLAKGNKTAKDAKDAKTKPAKKSNAFVTQPSSSRRIISWPSLKSERANICIPSKQTRTTLPRDSKTGSTVTSSKKSKLKTESSRRRKRNDSHFI